MASIEYYKMETKTKVFLWTINCSDLQQNILTNICQPTSGRARPTRTKFLTKHNSVFMT